MIMGKKWKVRNAMNWEPMKGDFEESIGPSMTVPGECFTIEEIVSRFSGGVLPVTVSPRGELVVDDEASHDDLDFERMQRLERDEVAEIALEARERRQLIEDQLKGSDQPEPVKAILDKKEEAPPVE